MSAYDLILMVGVVLSVGIMLATQGRRKLELAKPRSYRCPEMVPDAEMAVTYRDAPMKQCSYGVRLYVAGDCVVKCPKHGIPMTRVS